VLTPGLPNYPYLDLWFPHLSRLLWGLSGGTGGDGHANGRVAGHLLVPRTFTLTGPRHGHAENVSRGRRRHGAAQGAPHSTTLPANAAAAPLKPALPTAPASPTLTIFCYYHNAVPAPCHYRCCAVPLGATSTVFLATLCCKSDAQRAASARSRRAYRTGVLLIAYNINWFASLLARLFFAKQAWMTFVRVVRRLPPPHTAPHGGT